MRLKTTAAVTAALAFTLVSCDRHKAPTGQVVATVDGQEVTVRDLQTELSDAAIRDPKARQAAQQAALKQVVYRKLVAEAARKQGLDKVPEFAIERQRADEMLLVKALQDKVAKSVPMPTRDEAERFIEANPNIFAQRKIFDLEQIRFATPSDPAIVNALRPLKTLDEVVVLLNSKGIPYRRGTDRIDALGTDPRIINQIAGLPPGEMFALPANNLVLVNMITSTEVLPLTGAAAIDYATDLLHRQRVSEAVMKTYGGIIGQGAKTVQYNKAYAPPPDAPAGPQAPQAAQGAQAPQAAHPPGPS